MLYIESNNFDFTPRKINIRPGGVTDTIQLFISKFIATQQAQAQQLTKKLIM